jgi:hypothetical protein
LTKRENTSLLFELWVSVIADGWVIGPVFSDERAFLASNLTIVCVVKEFSQDFLSDREVPSLFPGKILGDEFTIGTTKVVDIIGGIVTNIDLSIWIRDLINNLHMQFVS